MFKKVLYIFSYLFYICFLLVFFAHVLFPEKKGAAFISDILKKQYQINFYADSFKPVFPFNFEIKNMEISSLKVKNIEFEEVKINVSILSLVMGNLKFKINANGFGGTINSDIKLSLLNYMEKFNIDAQFENIDLNKTSTIFDSDFILSGIAGGRVKLDFASKKGNYSSMINLKNFDIVSKFIIVPVSVFDINNANIHGKIEGNNLFFEDSTIRSKAGFSNFNGKVQMNKIFERSIADINGKFVPDTESILKNKSNPSMAMLIPILQNKKNIEFTIKGSVSNPAVRFK